MVEAGQGNLSGSLWANQLSQHANHEFEVDDSNPLRTLIDREKRNIESRGAHLYTITQRSRYFAHYLLSRCIEEGLPVELALIPMVESAFDPFAFSQGGASGLWQFVTSTGKHFGLHSNWWFDDRRDPIRSTEAAFQYFSDLRKRFGSWPLAVAAYNAGPTRLSRALRNDRAAGGTGEFTELDLPRETRAYLPRLLALRELLISTSNPRSIFPVADQPYFEVVELPGQLDLALASELSGAPITTLYQLNAGLNQWATPPEGPHRLLVPVAYAGNVVTALQNRDSKPFFEWQMVEVRYGDTLGEIAQDKKSRLSHLRMANDIQGARIKPGQKLLVPVPVAASGSVTEAELTAQLERQLQQLRELRQGVRKVAYRVVAGDSWWKVARKFNVAMGELLAWNNAQESQALRIGRKLVIWQPVEERRRNVARTIYYKVRKGDSLSRIASRFNVSPEQIVARNDLRSSQYLQPGQNLRISVPIVGHNVD